MLDNTSKDLYDLLVTRNLNPELRDTTGKTISDPGIADMFSFSYRGESGKDYGTVVIFLTHESLQVFYADNVGRNMDSADKDGWYAFLQQLSIFAKRHRISFDLSNINRLRYTMMGQAAIKEGLFESWSGRKNVSYNDGANTVRLMIRHNRDLGEGDQRFRHIDALFLETADGERFKLAFKSLAGGKAMCEHVRNGGRPYDVRGAHITEIVNEIAVLTRFSRCETSGLFEDDTLVESAGEHLAKLKRSLRSLGSSRGYTNYFENWNPATIDESDVVIEEVRNLLTNAQIDDRIKRALPYLLKLGATPGDEFAQWADTVTGNITP